LRAFYLKDLIQQDVYSLKGDEAHHLINVVRLQVSEELLLLNGQGLKVFTAVEFVNRKELVLKYVRHEEGVNSSIFDLALGIPKKEALELSLKQAVELGFGRIFLVRADYSQIKIPDLERLQALLVSALEQSNSPFLPQLLTCEWEKVPFGDYAQINWMNSQPTAPHSLVSSRGPQLLIVGPEGGFSPNEVHQISKLENLQTIHLPTPILRTPTAISAGAGFLLGRLLNQDNCDKLK
jgi:16S rRNA (uracil1498-N3)-methyltransferase